MNNLFQVCTVIILTALFQLFASDGLAQTAGCTIGFSQVACENSKRTIVVAKSGTANHRTIQQALNVALPGDTILVRAGVYQEPMLIAASGTASLPIIVRAYPGERPVIEPRQGTARSYVGLAGSWLIVDGFEIRYGRHGVIVTGSNNLLRNNYIHDSGDTCATEYCGQGILVASASNVVIQKNRIERNGLSSFSPWHLHGIYLSDYHKRGVSRVTIAENVIDGHGGAGVHVWDPSSVARDVLVFGNLFQNNVVDLLLARAENVIVKGNTLNHGSHPATSATETALLWLELSKGVAFDGNTFRYVVNPAETLRVNLIHLYATDQDARQLTWQNNVWDLPSAYGRITDAEIMRMSGHQTATTQPPSAPTGVHIQ